MASRAINLRAVLRRMAVRKVNSVSGPSLAIQTAPSGLWITNVRRVPTDWADYNRHMTESKYLQVFSDATDQFMAWIGADSAYIASGFSYFTVESHIRHLAEVQIGAQIHVETQCLKAEGKKLHLFHFLWSDGILCATGEHFLLHVDLATRKSCLPTPDVQSRLNKVGTAQAHLPWPDGAGRGIGAARGG